jgi:hypothetical protein
MEIGKKASRLCRAYLNEGFGINRQARKIGNHRARL